jgi:hypothetical protein
MGPRFTIHEEPKQIGKGHPNGQESSHLGTGGVSPGLPHGLSRQMPVPDEMTLNVVWPFDYQPHVSAYEGLNGSSFN